MSIIVKRLGVGGKGSALTSSEIDANVNNLNNDKVEINNPTFKAAPSLVNNLIPLTGTVLPAINPSLNLDFANGKQLDPRITFSRNTVATYINKYGLLVSAASNVPRFDYDPITKKCLGLLIEELRTNSLLNSTIDGANLATQDITTTAVARTLSFYGTGSVTLSGRVNLLTKTEDFSAVVWEKPDGALSITGGVSDPLGGSTAFTLTTSAVNQRFSQLNGLSNISASVWIRRRTGSGAIGLFNGTAWPALAITSDWKLFSVSGGSLFSLYLSASGDAFDVWHPDLRPTNTTNFLPAYQRVNTTTDFTPATATITGLGAYPTRTTYTYTPTAGTLTLTVSGTVQYANDEVGAFATSYIPTAGTEKSRAADNASMTGVNFSSWYNSSQSSFYIEFDTFSTTAHYLISSQPGDLRWMYFNNASTSYQSYDGSNQLLFGSYTSGIQKSVISTSTTNMLGVANGLTTYSALGSIAFKNATVLFIGSYGGGSNYLNGHIRKLTYYPKALTAVELQGLTS